MEIKQNKIKRLEIQKKKMIEEISNCVSSKIFNLKNGTIKQREKQILFEALGFLNMINYSSMPFSEIREHWEKSNLKFQ